MKKHLLIALIIFFALLNCSCLKPVVVEGTAMNPNLKDGDRIFLKTNIRELERGEIISFLYPKDKSKWYIKRVIGLPGEKIEIIQGEVYINNKKLEEKYLDESYNLDKRDFAPRIVPEGQYYVLGDNRDNSSDSRAWGTVPKDLIQGRYYATYLESDKK
jgi:signal peptidase I